uniref:30S ribosomal protein S1 n=1 Tax=candidate division WOR-3 bacterium TaxID=2052148 RepID=A0A7C4U6X7_UNCW3
MKKESFPIENANEEEIEKLLSEYVDKEKPKVGLVKGRVVRITNKEVIVNVGLKSEGILPLSEFEPDEKVKVDDVIDVYLEDLEGEHGLAQISKKKADFMKVWDDIKNAYENEINVTGKILRRVKGGLMASVFGVEAFLPGSQIDVKNVDSMDDFVGKELPLRIIKLNWKRRNIVVSRRKILEEEKEMEKKKFFSSVKEGDILEGTVKNITEFGAFVDLGGIDGLLHITDMSWGRIAHPSEILAIGDTVKVKVIKIDREQERISLGMKQLEPNPWDGIEERYPTGKRVKGRVVSITDYGAFVELEKGVEGLIHISEMSWTEHIKHPSEVMKIGDIVEGIVIEVNKEEQKISLGMREASPDPWKNVSKKYYVGQKVEGIVSNIKRFGVFIELEEGVEGLLHISDVSWTKRNVNLNRLFRKGKKVHCKILAIEPAKRRISLGLKQLTVDPLKTFERKHPVNSKLKAKIVEILSRGLVVDLGHELTGFVPLSHLKKGGKKPSEQYSVGEELNLSVLEINTKTRNIFLSEKKYYEEEGEKAVKREEEKKEIKEEKKESEGNSGNTSEV